MCPKIGVQVVSANNSKAIKNKSLPDLGWWQPPPEKTPKRTFETILNRFFVQFLTRVEKEKLPPLYIDHMKCGIRHPPPRQLGGPLCEQTERDGDMKILGFVRLN